MYKCRLDDRKRLRWSGVLAALTFSAAQAQPAVAGDWQLVGRQGMIQIVIAPMAHAGEREAYAEQVKRLCTPGQTCFINFFTNSTQATPALPLPDAISNEATAIYRHSMKQGAELFRWSCRLGKDPANCF